MIIAEIGGQKFLLEGVKDAEQLLCILSRATTLKESYDLPYDNRLYEAPSDYRGNIEISIIGGKPLTYEAAQEAIAAAMAKKEQKNSVTV